MARDKDRKRIVRRRMKKTGESYTTARAHIIARQSQPKPPAPVNEDLAARAGMSDERISEKTGRTWQQWLRVLDADGASDMRHRDIAALVQEKHGVGDWWAQTVTVGYERMKGLRERGQRRGGLFEASKSKTFNVPVGALFEAWSDANVRRQWLDRSTVVVRSATRAKSMRLLWPDGTMVVLWFTPRGPSKSVVALAHTKLRDRAAVEESKKYWTARLDALGALLAGQPA